MKNKSNPFLRHSLSLAASSAFLSMGAAHAATYDWTGATDSNFTTGSNWSQNAWTQWDDYCFGANTPTPTNTSITINGYFGIGSLTLQSGLTENIVINSTEGQPVIMNTSNANGGLALISIAADSSNLTINGKYIANNTVTWDVGAGRTLTMNGTLDQWFAAASLVKNGAGTAVLAGHFGFSGGAAINDGTLELHVASGSRDLGNMTFSGPGTLRKAGAGGVGWGPGSATFALGAGSLIDVQEGSFGGGSYGNENWTGNLAGLNVASGATFSGVEANVRVAALTGAGTISSGYPGAGYQNFTFGVNNGSGTFNGTLADSDSAPANFVKEGTGTQVLTGSNSYTGTTTVLDGTLSLGNGTTNTNLSDAATVSIASGATVHLNFTGSDSVGKLIINGETLPGGVYDGSLSTPEPYRSYFSGTGSLTVLEQDGTWTSATSGYWSNSANWLSNLIATGADNTATFSTGTGGETIIVTLDSNREIANLAFSNANYTITGNTLTLDSSSSLSTFSVASGNSATIGSALAGTPNLDKTGDGTLTLSGALSYSGTTTVSAGTLELQGRGDGGGSNYNGGNLSIHGASTLRISGQRYNFSGKTFTFDSTGGGTFDAISSGAGGFVFMGTNTFATSGGAQNVISGSKSGADNKGFNLNGSNVIFNVETGSDLTSDLKVIGTIWNGGSVTKNGAGRLEFSATQQYSGTSTVNDGTLILGDGSNNIGLSDAHDVSVDSDATLQLNYPVGSPDSIDELFLGGVQVASGTWGSLSSGAEHTSALITGTGLLNVLTGPPVADPFANWMVTNFPGLVSPNNETAADPDNDGISNLLEYVLQGGDPSTANPGILPKATASGTNFVFTYLRRAAATGTTQTFEYSATLAAGSWTPISIPGTGVVVTPDTPSAGIEQVVITVAKGTNTKLFGRLQVVK